MSKKRTLIFNIINEVEKEALVEDTLAKIDKLSKKNTKKDRYNHCFITSQEIYSYISENEIPVMLRGFNLFWHNGFNNFLFFGEYHQLEEPSSVYTKKKVLEKLKQMKGGDNNG